MMLEVVEVAEVQDSSSFSLVLKEEEDVEGDNATEGIFAVTRCMSLP